MKTKYDFKEIFKLRKMLDEAGIEYEFIDKTNKTGNIELTNYHIELFNENGDKYLSVTQSFGSYGREQDKLEIMGLLTPEEQMKDRVVGYLTAEDVFKRITKYLDKEDNSLKYGLLKIINHYGVNGQQRKLMEEVFELQETITLFKNNNGTKEHITEEMADVLVILSQFIYFYNLDIDKITKMMKYKAERQIKRIESEEKDEN